MTRPPHSRRHRALTDDERTLWHAVAKTAVPLKRGKRARKAAESVDETAPPPPRSTAPVSTSPHPKPPKPAEKPAAPPALAPLSRREKARLSRGRQEIDARIDLHGMTQARAHRALLAFLQRAHAEGAVFVLVITGKGRVSGEHGVLRRQVPHWFELPEFRAVVVGYEQAHVGHGGEGALYVRVRRARG